MIRITALRLAGAVLLAGAALSPSGGQARAAEDPRATFMQTLAASAEEEAYAIALEAYLYGYPRVELARRIQSETNRTKPDQVIYAPVNAFYYFDRLARPGDGKVIKAPNNDTLYASGYLDLSRGPVVLRVPDLGERYYVALIVDAAGGVSNRLGATVSGRGGVDHVFIAPGQEASVLPDARRIPIAGADAWVLMRLATDGTAADEKRAAKLLRHFRLVPLSDLRGFDGAQGRNADVAAQPLVAPVEPFGKLQFFAVLDAMLRRNPPPPADQGLLARWQRIGLGGDGFDPARLSEPVRRGIERAIAAGEGIVAAAQFGIANTINGWNFSTVIGRTGADWALNAAIAKGGYGNMAEDSVYHQRTLDAAGVQLTGARQYRLTFPKGQLPPVGRFWSLTAYDQASFDLIDNPARRYAIGDRTRGLAFNPDGSLTIAIQHDQPRDPVLRANWLPVGEGPFYMVIRSYDPATAQYSGGWAPPQLQALDSDTSAGQ